MPEETKFKEDALIEQFRSVMQVSALALRSAMLINGGAAIALLTFLGNTKDNVGVVYFVCALKLYIVGVTLATFANGTAYLAQYRYLYELRKEGATSRGQYITYTTILLVFLSYVVFVFGGWTAANGFSQPI